MGEATERDLLEKAAERKAARVERMKRLLPHFDGSVYIAVFNSREQDHVKARKAVIKRFGVERWKKEVLPARRTGIMAVFRHERTPILWQYVLRVAVSADRRRTSIVR
jgi:hypothetical protein